MYYYYSLVEPLNPLPSWSYRCCTINSNPLPSWSYRRRTIIILLSNCRIHYRCAYRRAYRRRNINSNPLPSWSYRCLTIIIPVVVVPSVPSSYYYYSLLELSNPLPSWSYRRRTIIIPVVVVPSSYYYYSLLELSNPLPSWSYRRRTITFPSSNRRIHYRRGRTVVVILTAIHYRRGRTVVVLLLLLFVYYYLYTMINTLLELDLFVPLSSNCRIHCC